MRGFEYKTIVGSKPLSIRFWPLGQPLGIILAKFLLTNVLQIGPSNMIRWDKIKTWQNFENEYCITGGICIVQWKFCGHRRSCRPTIDSPRKIRSWVHCITTGCVQWCNFKPSRIRYWVRTWSISYSPTPENALVFLIHSSKTRMN